MKFVSRRALWTAAACLWSLTADPVFTADKTPSVTGDGAIIRRQDDTTRVTFSAALRCGPMPVRPPNNLEIQWSGNVFQLQTVTNSFCDSEGDADPGAPHGATFNTLWLTGVGSYNGASGYTIVACFTDAGEPGTDDDFSFVLHDPGGNEVFLAGGTLVEGNLQAHK